jgi:oxygen-independent coproporphyrinogen III oxidase
VTLTAPRPGVRHLYVHLPFCSSRCGYCDFVTVVGRRADHARYARALLRELDLECGVLAPHLETVYLGGGTPTFTEEGALAQLLGSLPRAEELTVEANPETVTAELALLLRRAGVDRVSLGAQSFEPRLLDVLGRVATPDDVRRGVYALRDAGFDNISIDLIYGIPGQRPADLAADLAQAVALEPEHVSAYELEAKPGTRFTHAHGAALDLQAEAMETYFETVVSTLTGAGYRWYETANFCLEPTRAGGRDLRAKHNLGYWLGHDYLGLGVGAVGTVAGRRTRNTLSLGRYLGAVEGGQRPPREIEELSPSVQAAERLMLGLRLDESVPFDDVRAAIDQPELERLDRAGLVSTAGGEISLTRRGRFLGGGVTARLLAPTMSR